MNERCAVEYGINYQNFGASHWVSNNPNLSLHSMRSLLNLSSGLKRAG